MLCTHLKKLRDLPWPILANISQHCSSSRGTNSKKTTTTVKPVLNFYYSSKINVHLMEVATTVSQKEFLVSRYSHTKSIHHFIA